MHTERNLRQFCSGKHAAVHRTRTILRRLRWFSVPSARAAGPAAPPRKARRISIANRCDGCPSRARRDNERRLMNPRPGAGVRPDRHAVQSDPSPSLPTASARAAPDRFKDSECCALRAIAMHYFAALHPQKMHGGHCGRMCACVRACVRECVRACVRAFLRVCVCV